MAANRPDFIHVMRGISRGLSRATHVDVVLFLLMGVAGQGSEEGSRYIYTRALAASIVRHEGRGQ